MLGRMLHAEVMRFKPDLVFAVAQSPATVSAVEAIREQGTKVAYWFVEDFETLDYWKGLHGHFDLFLTIQRGRCHRAMLEHSNAPLRYLPMCADPDIAFPEPWPGRETPGLSFVGAGYHNRERMFLELMDQGLKIWGSDWRSKHPVYGLVQDGGNRTDSLRNRQIFASSRINLNLHSSTYHSGVNPHGDFVNPRTFEILACGGFQLVDRRSLLDELLKSGSDLVSYSSVAELKQQIEYYKDRAEERDLISKHGRKTVLRRHTYRQRMAEFLELALLLDQGFFPFAETKVEDELAAVNDSELQAYFAQLPNEVPRELDRIARHIQQQEGPRQQAESVLLFMHEIREWAREKRLEQLAEFNRSE
jgi:spore maturation protein CgeB